MSYRPEIGERVKTRWSWGPQTGVVLSHRREGSCDYYVVVHDDDGELQSYEDLAHCYSRLVERMQQRFNNVDDHLFLHQCEEEGIAWFRAYHLAPLDHPLVQLAECAE